jgi:hypothetical protein
MRIFRCLSILTALLALAACSTKPTGAPSGYGSSGWSSQASKSTSELCPYESAHVASDGTAQESGYYCSMVVSQDTGSSSSPAPGAIITSGCGYVAAYTKRNGTSVGPFVRCKTYAAATAHMATLAGAGSGPGTGTGTAPCVSSYCGPVQVRGYYRKDGTYVRPYTRRR